MYIHIALFTTVLCIYYYGAWAPFKIKLCVYIETAIIFVSIYVHALIHMQKHASDSRHDKGILDRYLGQMHGLSCVPFQVNLGLAESLAP